MTGHESSHVATRVARTLASRFSRPDYALAGIAVVFLSGVAVAAAVPSHGTLAVGTSSVLALCLVGDVLFRNPPHPPRSAAPNPGETPRPDYLTNVRYDSGCVEVWDHLSEVRYDA